MLFFLYLLASLVICIKTLSYGFFEWKQKENKVGGAMVISIALISFVFSNVMFFFF